ncbi:insulinase family protein [Candidatus Uhrbacteria bacterium]|nr:insulinase family protein [Candidatus Uhrbacteria bacterium]
MPRFLRCEKGGLAYRISASHSEYEDTGLVAILAGLAGDRLGEAHERVMAELEDLKTHGPTDEEMHRTREFLRGQMLLGLEDSSVRAEWYAKNGLFYEKAQTPEERLTAYAQVTPEDIQRLAQSTFDTSRMTVSYIGKESEASVKTALKLP